MIFILGALVSLLWRTDVQEDTTSPGSPASTGPSQTPRAVAAAASTEPTIAAPEVPVTAILRVFVTILLFIDLVYMVWAVRVLTRRQKAGLAKHLHVA